MKIKLLKVAAALGTGAILLTSVVSAQTALTATCVGVVSGTSITWTATPVNGTAPYTYVWTGAPNITGHNTASFTETYTANGTYTASVAVTDTAAPTTATATATCQATVTAVTTTPPPATMVKKPDVNIGPDGKILVHGMLVTSVGTNTFQGTVWGINYTVNLVSPAANVTFLFREGNEAAAGTQIAQQLKVGDEVGVLGKVTTAAPLVINGQIVRNYSILKLRPMISGDNKGEKHEGDDDKNKNNGTMNSGSNDSQKALLLQLLQQVQVLQKQFQEKFGTPSTQ